MRREFLRWSVEEHEARHRRRVLVVIGVLTLVAISPVVGHHLTTRLSDAFSGQDHFWILCLVALHELMAPAHTIFHVLLMTGIVYAVADRVRAWISVRRTLGGLKSREATPVDAVWEASRESGVPVAALRLVEGLPNPAFTTGWLRPVIFVDTNLQSELTQLQLGAVLRHEYAHVLRRDPARLTFLRALGCLLFWLPALRRLAQDFADDAEISADNFAARGDPVVLASAILQLAESYARGARRGAGASALPDGGRSVIGFQRDAMLDRRIHRLLGNEAPIVTHVTWRSIVAASAGLILAWSSGIAVAHPMTPESLHCDHQHAWAFEHLFCIAGHARGPNATCPHEDIANR